MATSKGSSARRREVRRNMPRSSERWMHWLRQPEIVWAGLFIMVFAAFSSLIAVSTKGNPAVQVGQVMSSAATARVRFRAIDQDKTRQKKSDARDREPAFYVPNEPYLIKVRERLMGVIELAAKESIEQIPEEERQGLTPEGLAELHRLATVASPSSRNWLQLTDQFMAGFAGIAVLDGPSARTERDPRQRPSKIVIQHPTLRALDRYDNVLISIQHDQKALQESVTTLANKFPKSLRQVVVAEVMKNPEPIYRIDQEETGRRRQLAYDQEPAEEMTYQPGDVLVPPGMIVQLLDLQVLEQERSAYMLSLGPAGRWLPLSGHTGLVVLLAIALWTYIVSYNPRITANAMRGSAITILLLLCQALAVIGSEFGPKFIYATGTLPTLLGVIILAIAYDRRFALSVGAMHTLLVLVSLEQTLGFGLVLLTGVAVTGSLLKDVRNRSTLVKVGLWNGSAMAAVLALVGFAWRPLHLPNELTRIGFDACLVFGTGFATGLVIQGILPAIEQLFSVTTSMTLRELNDASHPLLRRLAQESPGTYQHSLQIADMAETAADAIGANGLLCKVGAMYHDIGKINKPTYFVENQGGGPNRHDKLSPAMSLLIIVGHVKDGMEMAREYNLPRPLRHFIESHHGTTLVSYFYHAAKQKQEAIDQPAPAEFEFRYPGPKPHTKEAAILMLCDGVESAARALDDPTSVRIEQLVHTIANKRLMDGQFDECSITLQELHKIEQSLIKTLCAIHHSRVKYPSDEEQSEEPANEAQAAS